MSIGVDKYSYLNNQNNNPHSLEYTGKFARDVRAKPNPGLNLQNLSNIPKDIKKRMNVKVSPSLNILSTKTTQSQKSASAIKFNETNREAMKLSSESFYTNNKNFLSNNKIQRTSSSSFTNRPSSVSSKKFNNVQSPTANIFKSYRCHKYHTDLDFNYLSNQKFLKDAVTCGKDKLSTVALRSTSPDKYFYQNKKSPDKHNRYTYINRNREEINSNNIDELITETNEITEINQKEGGETKKTSKGILSEILDHQFSINSPSQLKIFQDEKDINQGQTHAFKKNIYGPDQDNKLAVDLSYNGTNPSERFIESLENVMTYLDPIYESLSLNERIEKFLECTNDKQRGVKLGSLTALYLILRKFQVEENLKLLVLEKIISLLQDYESQEELFLVACLEICTLFSPHDLLLENISLICMFITDFNFPTLQKASFNCLMTMEYEGIRTLVDLASKDYQDYQRYILNSLLNTQHIQKIIIIRALLNDLYSNNPEKRHSALAALSRMQDLVGDPETLSKLTKFYNEPKIEKIFLSSTIRTSGIEGEKILLREIKSNKDFGVRVAIASVLAYRIPKNPRYLKLKLDCNDTYALAKTLPGDFCTYYGKVSPYVYEDDAGETDDEYLEVSTRDFLAALKRMLVMNYDHTNALGLGMGINNNDCVNLLENLSVSFRNSTSEVIKKYFTYFDLGTDGTDPKDIDGKLLISDDIIKALCICLRDYSTAVRETAAGTIGQIGLPESLPAIEYLVNSIRDEDVNVKSKAIWAIGRISAGCDNSVIVPIVEALKSNMWKVKCTCLFALSQFGSRCVKLALPLLIKLLKESAINKQTIAETIVKLGSEGESLLLKLMNTENDSNYKLKSSIAKSLALTNILSTNIDFIVECLFKSANSNNNIIRKSSLFSIRILAEKAEERITYLKRKNIIPFYYEKMLDKEPTIQAYAISCIKSLGAQGELIFIEGLTKDMNPLIRQNSAIGLAEIGPHTLRTLLIALHDENFNVRRTVEKEIIEKFTIDDILNTFGLEKNSQRMSLKITLRDILEKELNINVNTRNFFQNLLIGLENQNFDNNIQQYHYPVNNTTPSKYSNLGREKVENINPNINKYDEHDDVEEYNNKFNKDNGNISNNSMSHSNKGNTNTNNSKSGYILSNKANKS